MIRANSSREHTNREYEGELRRLREQLLLMGAKVEDIIAGSIRALIDRDSALAEQMIAVDRKINQDSGTPVPPIERSTSWRSTSTSTACRCSRAGSRSRPTCAS